MESERTNPAQLAEYDQQWAELAEQLLSGVKRVLGDLPGSAEALFDHIGSTSVPGLAAKPIIDLQVRILPLPSDKTLSARLMPLGLKRAVGSRPDSPGVYRDIPRGSEIVPAEVWQKSLFVDESGTTILHIRRTDSPWGGYTVWFRDWLREHEEQRYAYEHLKRRLSAANDGKDDYDDYTRAKTVFFDQVQDEFARWASARR